MAKIIVYVDGGNVQTVIGDVDDIEVQVFDVDNLKAEGKTEKQIEKEWKKVSNGCKNDLY